MPNVYTAKHEPPIESALVRTIFFGGHEDEMRMWRVVDRFSDTGALPSASYGLLMIGVNAMVYHHSSSENEKGQRSVVCSVPGSPLVFVCDAAAIVAKPFGQQSHDYMLMVMRKQGLKPCDACGGAGRIPTPPRPGDSSWMPTLGQCATCNGEGFIPLNVKTAPATPEPTEETEKQAKIMRLRNESGFNAIECKVALETKGWDFDQALEFLDEQRRRFGK